MRFIQLIAVAVLAAAPAAAQVLGYAGTAGTCSTAMVATLTISDQTEDQVIKCTVPANSIVAGTTLRVVLQGQSTVANAASGQSTFRLRLGSNDNNGTSLGTLVVTSSATNGTSPFRVEYTVTFRSVDAAQTFGMLSESSNGAGGIYATALTIVTAGNNTTGLTATVAASSTFQLTYQASNANISPQFLVATIETVRP